MLNYDNSIDPAKVFTVPIAANSYIFYKNTSQVRWNEVKSKYYLPEKYFLSIASNDARKNILHVIKSFVRFYKQENPEDIHLVLAGNYQHSRDILNTIDIGERVKKKLFL